MAKDDFIEAIETELQQFQIELPYKNHTYAQLQAALSNAINRLITHDFNRLVVVLYRLDISETKLKNLLAEPGANATGVTIAAMIIERQIQKIQSRKAFSRQPDNIAEDEKW